MKKIVVGFAFLLFFMVPLNVYANSPSTPQDIVPKLVSGEINLSSLTNEDLTSAYNYYIQIGELQGISFNDWEIALKEGLDAPVDPPMPINTNLRASPLQSGDYIIVPGESSAGGLVGHNGIVVGPDSILHSPGGTSSGQATVIMTIKQFTNKYGFGNSRLYRPNRLSLGSVNMMAGWYALSTTFNSNGSLTVRNRSIDYSIIEGSKNLQAPSPTYCSKLVYQAYAYGTGGSPIVPQPPVKVGLVAPRSLGNYFTQTPDYIGSF